VTGPVAEGGSAAAGENDAVSLVTAEVAGEVGLFFFADAAVEAVASVVVADVLW
jgi:hypothetical protein